jgi:FtsZ-interacting cell division protein YlmF
MWGFVDLGAG